MPKLMGVERVPVGLDPLTRRIIGCAFKVSNTLGHGFPEAIYQNALMLELSAAGLQARKQVPLSVTYAGQMVGQFFADIIVNDTVILELKAVERLLTEHQAQLINYLTVTGFETGLLINFGRPRIEFHRCGPRTSEQDEVPSSSPSLPSSSPSS